MFITSETRQWCNTSAIAIAAACCVIACSTANGPAAAESQVKRLTPALRLTFEPSTGQVRAPFDVLRFSYASEPPNEWPYGTGFAVADSVSGEVLWIYLHNGDFPPHEIRWADFDGDGQDDIFFHAGFEDVATTHLYVNRVRSRRFAVSHFAHAYSNESIYAVVVDFDGDNRPELIAPDAYPSDDDPCAEEFGRAAAFTEWKEEYVRLAGRFDAFNFQFGASAGEYDALQLFSKPVFVSFGRKPSAAAVRRHLLLRRQLITRHIDSLSKPCRARAAELAAYIDDLIQQYETGTE